MALENSSEVKRRPNNERSSLAEVKHFLCYFCGNFFQNTLEYQKHIINHQLFSLSYQVWNARTTQSTNESLQVQNRADAQKVDRKRNCSKRNTETPADLLMELKTQEESEKADKESANNARDARHIARAAKLREIEARQTENERANGGSETEEAPPKRSYRIRRNEVEDVQYPFAWRARVYGKVYNGSDTEHFALRKY